MKKALLFILMLTSIILLGACDKKSYQARSMDNYLTDFKVAETEYDNYERIVQEEKGANKSVYLSKMLAFGVYPNNKTIINTISFTIYNHSEDYTFYIYNPKDIIISKTKTTDGRDYYLMSSGDINNLIEIKPNEEYDVIIPANLKMKKGSGLKIFTLFCFPDGPNTDDAYTKTMEASGIYKYKVDYEIYM